MAIQFWINDPSILLNKDYITELWPTGNMCFEQKINAITRLVILLTILGFIFTRSMKILFSGIFTIAAIVILVSFRKKKFMKDLNPISEGFQTGIQGQEVINDQDLKPFLKEEFQLGNKKNPFSNVLLTEIMDSPERKSAPPSFNPDVDEDIVTSTKRMVQYLNPGINNTNKQLFSSLTDNFDLDNSLRVWNSTPNTKIANDQGAFAQYLYGNMPSSHDSTAEGAMQRVADAYRYTLY